MTWIPTSRQTAQSQRFHGAFCEHLAVLRAAVMRLVVEHLVLAQRVDGLVDRCLAAVERRECFERALLELGARATVDLACADPSLQLRVALDLGHAQRDPGRGRRRSSCRGRP